MSVLPRGRDVEKNEAVTSFIDHGGDVMSLSVLPSVNRHVFVSGSCDATAKVQLRIPRWQRSG
jgi:hypothetical protein